MSDGRLKAAIQITAELTAMARRADGYRAGYAAGLEAAADYVERIGDYASEARAADIRSLPIPEIDK
jgi:hypothetical protein